MEHNINNNPAAHQSSTSSTSTANNHVDLENALLTDASCFGVNTMNSGCDDVSAEALSPLLEEQNQHNLSYNGVSQGRSSSLSSMQGPNEDRVAGLYKGATFATLADLKDALLIHGQANGFTPITCSSSEGMKRFRCNARVAPSPSSSSSSATASSSIGSSLSNSGTSLNSSSSMMNIPMTFADSTNIIMSTNPTDSGLSSTSSAGNITGSTTATGSAKKVKKTNNNGPFCCWFVSALGGDDRVGGWRVNSLRLSHVPHLPEDLLEKEQQDADKPVERRGRKKKTLDAAVAEHQAIAAGLAPPTSSSSSSSSSKKKQKKNADGSVATSSTTASASTTSPSAAPLPPPLVCVDIRRIASRGLAAKKIYSLLNGEVELSVIKRVLKTPPSEEELALTDVGGEEQPLLKRDEHEHEHEHEHDEQHDEHYEQLEQHEQQQQEGTASEEQELQLEA